MIKNLRPSTDILFELASLNFQTKKLQMCFIHRPRCLSLCFFIDLKSNKNNPDIFKLTSLSYIKIKVETPYVRKCAPKFLCCQ